MIGRPDPGAAGDRGIAAEPGAAGDGGPLGADAGIAAACRLVQGRPARLGATRLIAVDGPSGSGKTSLAAPLAGAVAGRIGGTVVRPDRVSGLRARGSGVGSGDSTDASTGSGSTGGSDSGYDAMSGTASYPRGRPVPEGPLVAVVSTDLLATWEHPLGWWPIVEEHLLAPLAAGSPATMPVTQWVSGNPRPGGEIRVPPVDVLVFEGVSSGRAAIADRLSILVWVEVPGRRARLERAVARDGEAMRPHLQRWQVDEQTHFVADGTRSRADIVIDPSLG